MITSNWDRCWQRGDKARFMALEPFTVTHHYDNCTVSYDVERNEILDCYVVICTDGTATFDFARNHEEFTLDDDHYSRLMYLP